MPLRRPSVIGPEVARLSDIKVLNSVFSDSFTDRYRRDGMAGVRVPHLNPRVWRYAIEDAADGAMVWRNRESQVVAFNMVHRSGAEGWMGPLAVRPDCQGNGLGKRIVEAGVDWLQQQDVRIIGLETMPRTVDNIGFYSRMGFVPRHLTVTMTRELAPGAGQAASLLSVTEDGEAALESCRALTERVAPGCDFTRELQLTEDLELGDTSLVLRDGTVVGFGLWHSAPLAEGRPAEEMRVLKLVAVDEKSFGRVVAAMQAAGRALGLKRLAIRCQTRFTGAYRHLVGAGFNVQWTDLRMTLVGFDERPIEGAVVLSNWEI